MLPAMRKTSPRKKPAIVSKKKKRKETSPIPLFVPCLSTPPYEVFAFSSAEAAAERQLQRRRRSAEARRLLEDTEAALTRRGRRPVEGAVRIGSLAWRAGQT